MFLARMKKKIHDQMRYRSTSREAPLTSLRGAVLRGLAPDGGLYMPVEIARRSPTELEEFRRLPFTEVCFRVARPFAGAEVPEEVMWQVVSEAINFPVKLVSLSPGLHILELFHGPTLAFKDFGARFMARLMGYFVRDETRTLTVLVATSGDTGSAVAHGFLRRAGDSRGDSLSFEAHQRSAGKAIHYAGRKHHRAGSAGKL